MNSHYKDHRLRLVTTRFLFKKINFLKDITDIAPKDVWSNECNISGHKFSKPRTFLMSEIRTISNVLKIEPIKFFDIIVHELRKERFQPKGISDKAQLKISLLQDSLSVGDVQSFGKLIEIVSKSNVALVIGTNNNLISRLIDNPEEFTMRFVWNISIGLKIDPKTLFQLIENEILQKEGKKMIQIKGTTRRNNKIIQ